jgi:hypothetical protein
MVFDGVTGHLYYTPLPTCCCIQQIAFGSNQQARKEASTAHELLRQIIVCWCVLVSQGVQDVPSQALKTSQLLARLKCSICRCYYWSLGGMSGLC